MIKIQPNIIRDLIRTIVFWRHEPGMYTRRARTWQTWGHQEERRQSFHAPGEGEDLWVLGMMGQGKHANAFETSG